MSQVPIRMVSWGARLLYCGPAIELSWHANGVGEFSIALDGTLEVERADGQQFIAQTVFVPAGARHRMQFHSARIACLYVDVGATDGTKLVDAMVPLGGGYAIAHRDGDAIARAMDDLLADRFERSVRKSALAEAFGIEPLTAVDARLTAVLGRLHEEPAQAHRVATLARAAGLSEGRFRKAFRAATGVPFKRYRVWVRLTAAMNAAQAGESLTAAAHASGFSSSAHFSTAYRKMFGMTPSDFLQVLSGSASPSVDRAAGDSAA